MFNAMSPAQLTAVLATILRESADWSRELDGFQRGQLKSASSIGRHLTAELAGGPVAAAEFRGRLHDLLDTPPAGDTPPDGAALAGTAWSRAAGELRAALDRDPAGDLAALGGPVADLLAACRAGTGPAADTLAAQLRALLRDLVDAEIGVLSTPHPTGGTP